MYSYWFSALMMTVCDHDPQFSPELEKDWQKVLDHGMSAIKAQYSN